MNQPLLKPYPLDVRILIVLTSPIWFPVAFAITIALGIVAHVILEPTAWDHGPKKNEFVRS